MVGCISLPLISYFDEHQFKTIHGACAVAFFGSIGIYAFIVAGEMSANIDKFQDCKTQVTWMNGYKWTMLTTLVVLGVNIAVNGAGHWLTPASEWLITLEYLNYFSVLCMTSPYYDSIHAFGSF